MKTYYLYLVLVVILGSCGTKVPESPQTLIKESELYSKNIDADKNLESEMIEGALTDAEGFKDIGTFRYTVFFDKETKDLMKIVNIESTDKTITESYYFENNKLNYFYASGNPNPQKLYLKKGKVVSSENISSSEQKLFLAKAKRFQREYSKTH